MICLFFSVSGEWYKWHAYNFILAGLTDELIAAGAKPTVKNKILWIWTRYIKKHQAKQTGYDILNHFQQLVIYMVNFSISGFKGILYTVHSFVPVATLVCFINFFTSI